MSQFENGQGGRTVKRFYGGRAGAEVATSVGIIVAPLVAFPVLVTVAAASKAKVPTIPGHPYVSPYEDLRLKAR